MTDVKRVHSFAKQWLHENKNYEVYANGERILDYKREFSIYKIRDLKTEINIDQRELEQQNALIKEITYETLQRAGLMIISQEVDKKARWRNMQKVRYSIVPKNPMLQDYNQCPFQHKILFDIMHNAYQLIGKNAGMRGVGQWVRLKQQRVERNERILRNNVINDPYYFQLLRMKERLGLEEDQINKIRINEMPILYTESGEILCIENERDEPKIGVVGAARTGKSMLSHAILDRGYWGFHKRCGIINDSLRECGTWCQPWIPDKAIERGVTNKFIYLLRKIGQQPMPLPCVYLHPNTKDLKMITNEEEVGFKTSFPIREFIENHIYYFKAKKEWDLQKSGKYFDDLKPALTQCTTEEQVINTIREGIPQNMETSMTHLVAVMKNIFDQKILDISTGIASEWEIRKQPNYSRSFLPFTAMLVADLVPVLVTANIRHKDYFPIYFKFIVEDIFQKQVDDDQFIRNNYKIWLFCDELHNVDTKAHQTVASEILQQVVAEGGPARMGFIWASQNPSKISERIHTNTNYLFTLRFQNAEQATSIQKNYDLPKDKKTEILNLKPHQVMACTSRQFILYDRNGERYSSNEIITGEQAIKGEAIPSLSMHKPPALTD